MAKAGKSSKASRKADFDKTFATLKALLKRNRTHTRVDVDRPGYYSVFVKSALCKGRPLWFAGVRKGKSYVSYHLLPLYVCPELARDVPPGLKKRQQGKACFNFTAVEPAHLRELGALTKKGLAIFREKFAAPE